MTVPFYSDCVDWPRDKLAKLEWLIERGEEIHVDEFEPEVEAQEAYAGGWFMQELIDSHREGVRGTAFYRAPGLPIFWLTNSMVEYVFAHQEAVDGIPS